MILDTYFVFSDELRLSFQSTIWMQESCHFAFQAPLYVCLVYYENNPEIHLGGVPIGTLPQAPFNQKPTRLGLMKVFN